MNRKYLSLLVCITFLISSISSVAFSKNLTQSPEQIETSYHLLLNSEDAENIAEQLRSKGFDVLYDSITDNSLELVVTPNEFNKFKSRGYNFEILSRGRPFYEIQKEKYGNPLLFPGYPDYSDIFEKMINTQLDYPSICKVFDLTDTYDAPPTYEDRHIFAMKISDNVEEDEDEPNFLMVSCHHAREIVTPVIALYAIEQLTKEYGNDPDITSAVDDYEIWIVPVWNPDGYEYCYYVDNWWRKNRNPPDGVDLNRNYPFGWSSGCAGSTDPYSETYKGSAPASEAETKTMIAFTNDRHFAKVIDYHSYGREVLYGYCCHSHPFSSFFHSEAVSLATVAGYGGSTRAPSAEGEHYEWQIFTNGSYANLMETHNEFQPSYASALAEAAQVWPGTLWLLERPISVNGNIVDSITGEPIVTPINIVDVAFSNGEEFINEPRFGRYHLFLPPGTYTLEFSYANYHTQTHEVTVTSTSEEILNVELERLNEAPLKPTIDGPDLGIEDEEYDFTFVATDPEEDILEYYIEWGDGYIEKWLGPFESGKVVTLSHIWAHQGSYTIKAKVRDIYGLESDIEQFDITIDEKGRSANRVFKFLNTPLLKFLHSIIQRLHI